MKVLKMNLEKLKEQVDRLHTLLNDPHRGLMTWNEAIEDCVDTIANKSQIVQFYFLNDLPAKYQKIIPKHYFMNLYDRAPLVIVVPTKYKLLIRYPEGTDYMCSMGDLDLYMTENYPL